MQHQISSQAKAKIFLGEERSCDENDLYRVYNTFNPVGSCNGYKQPFNDLYVLHDITVAAGKKVHLKTDRSAFVFLLPVVGALGYKDTCGHQQVVNAGQLLARSINSSNIIVSNPYSNDLINFLELRIKKVSVEAGKKPGLFTFDIDKNRNKLVNLQTGLPPISIGKFTGRHEAAYMMKGSKNSLFVFVIQGAFEVEGRLLHARDGLALWNITSHTELEALSNDAIVLLIEPG